MDEQQSQFYLENLNFDQEEIVQPSYSVQSPVLEPQNKEPITLKAFNPYQFAENLPPKEQQKYLNMMMHNKTYMGLTHFINFEKSQEIPEFFNSIKSQPYVRDWTENPLHLEELFENQDSEQIKMTLQEIQQEINQINKKTFSEINIKHTIIPSFSENFENFLYLKTHLNFMKDLEVKIIDFTEKIKQKKQGHLIVEIYKFWCQAFEDFVLSIKKHTERYTLNFVKKLKDGESNSNPSNLEGKSTSSSRIVETQKRKAWKPSELEMLYKILQSNSTFNQAMINKVAQQLNRTSASVSSKIQKILKEHKTHNPDYQVHQNMTLLQKVINVLKNYPDGLSRQSVIERVNQHYEMGYDITWSKSVAQILSSRPQFVKIKGTYSLNGKFTFDMSKKTFKDKVVNCLLSIPQGKADLKRLVDQYISLYGTSEGISILSDQRRKTIEASISKSLCRYDIFNKQKSKTVYKLRQFCDQKEGDMEIESFLA